MCVFVIVCVCDCVCCVCMCGRRRRREEGEVVVLGGWVGVVCLSFVRLSERGESHS